MDDCTGQLKLTHHGRTQTSCLVCAVLIMLWKVWVHYSELGQSVVTGRVKKTSACDACLQHSEHAAADGCTIPPGSLTGKLHLHTIDTAFYILDKQERQNITAKEFIAFKTWISNEVVIIRWGRLCLMLFPGDFAVSAAGRMSVSYTTPTASTRNIYKRKF